MAEPIASEISSRITQELAPTTFACSSLVPLSGGTANFIFKGTLVKPSEDGTADVLVKHGEAFVAQHPALKLSTLRCVRRSPWASQTSPPQPRGGDQRLG